MDPMHGIFQGFDISGAGMRAELQRSEVVASNISNMHVAGGKTREPYRRRSVVFEEVLDDQPMLPGVAGAEKVASGVRVARVYEDHLSPFIPRPDPGNPEADENGFVQMPNVDLFKEMVDLSIIQRSFEANIAAMRAYRGLLQSALSNISRG